MAIAGNKLIPVLAIAMAGIVGVVLYQQYAGSGRVASSNTLEKVPSALPNATGADQDTPTETLKTVVAGNKKLQDDVQAVLEANRRLMGQVEADRVYGRRGPIGDSAASANVTGGQSDPNAATSAPRAPVSGAVESTIDTFGRAIDDVTRNASSAFGGGPGAPASSTFNPSSRASTGGSAEEIRPMQPGGQIQYTQILPRGYAVESMQPQNGTRGGVTTSRFVRTSAVDVPINGSVSPGPAGRAAQSAAQGGAGSDVTPYFTVPENSTLTGVTAMSSIIGRVPVDGRVTDPMQFKAIVGRENLAANGWHLPPDLEGMIVTGVAIGDMALSCSEGKIRSLTFVFNDGSIRTVSARPNNQANTAGSGQSVTGDLGYISDPFGNPCIPGKFVTNAPAYLTDIIGSKSLGIAAQALAQAQQTVQVTPLGGSQSTVTGSTGRFVLGQAANGATDELTHWLMSRLKNSFDAVVTPAGQSLVINIDQEVRIDKLRNARKIAYRNQDGQQLARGAHHGLE